jgi:hypothetical protein
MSARIHRTADLAVIDRHDRVVVLDLRRIDDPRPCQLEGTALAVWRAIDGVRDRDAVVAVLAADYAVEVGDIGADIDGFLVELERLGLVEIGSSSNTSSDGRS